MRLVARGSIAWFGKKSSLEEFKTVEIFYLKKFLDILILNETKNCSLSGYDIKVLMNREFNIRLSSGTIYSKLSLLERNNLIKPQLCEQVRYYKLTPAGQEMLNYISTLRANKFKKLSTYII
jgi:DNA-binding PadR family transcriptional regulator